MQSESHEAEVDTHREVSIIDKDDTASNACHIVDGFILEDSRQPFPVRTIEFFIFTPLILFSFST